MKTEEKEFFDNHIKNCFGCYKCPIVIFCGENKNNLNITCWNIYQNWLKAKSEGEIDENS